MEKEALYETRGNTMNTDEIDLTEVAERIWRTADIASSSTKAG
jgi:hypothetical protein